MKMRLYMAVESFRLRNRVLWAGDKIVLTEIEAEPLIEAGHLRELAARPVNGASWDAPMLKR